jgi:DNA (cytosine-5)-methyltransferase 1
MRPRLLDLFCCSGGAGMGYHRAGFDVVGVDIKPRPRYPFAFIRGDALDYLREHGQEFDAIHASPPCQAHSRASLLAEHQGRRRSTVDLVAPTRDLLRAIGRPYVIENVEGAPLLDPIRLCGSTFGLGVRRHRLFESSALLVSPGPCRHDEQGKPIGLYGSMGDTVKGTDSLTGRMVIGGSTARTIEEAQEAIGIDWTDRWSELKEAIPPAYTEHLGRQMLGWPGPGAP